MKYKTFIRIENEEERKELYDILNKMKTVAKQQRSKELIDKLITTVYNAREEETTTERMRRQYRTPDYSGAKTKMPDEIKEKINEWRQQ